MTELRERFSEALHNTARSWRQAVDRRLKSLGLSQASWLSIALAAKAATPMSQSELADKLGVEGATMVAMVDRLAKLGLVVREPSATDRRVKHVVVTPAGMLLYERVKTEAAALRQEILSRIDVEQLRLATELLEELRRIIETEP
jgi:MarR family transcriptional regulator, transcriptional regulator for hemolysin